MNSNGITYNQNTITTIMYSMDSVCMMQAINLYLHTTYKLVHLSLLCKTQSMRVMHIYVFVVIVYLVS